MILNAKVKEIGFIVLESLVIVGITLFGVFPFSCKVTTEGIEIIGGDYTPPTIENLSVVDEKTVTMEFSDQVNLRSVVISPVISGVSDSSQHSETEDLSPAIAAATGQYGKIDAEINSSENGKIITFNLQEATTIGKSYEIYGLVEDKIGNTLTFCMPFIGYNSKFPKLIMTEVQIKYGKGSKRGETVYRGEFVEFLVLEGGNLAGLELLSAADGENKKYSFPAIEVSKGEIFLVHLRTVGDGCVNEDGDNLDLATAPHSKNGVRDLWVETTTSHFNDSTDIIFVKNSVNNSILDGFMYAADDATEWKSSVADFAIKMVECGFYEEADISLASSSKGCSPLKSLTRIDGAEIYQKVLAGEEVELPLVNNAETWAVMAASPGLVEE